MVCIIVGTQRSKGKKFTHNCRKCRGNEIKNTVKIQKNPGRKDVFDVVVGSRLNIFHCEF